MKRSLMLVLLLSACTPLYLPPVPERGVPPPAERLELAGGSALTLREEGGLELRLQLANVPEAGWLAVQWFSPAGQEVASDSVWLAPGDVGVNPSFLLPGGHEVTPGPWRAVLSFEGRLVQQFALEVSAEQ